MRISGILVRLWAPSWTKRYDPLFCLCSFFLCVFLSCTNWECMHRRSRSGLASLAVGAYQLDVAECDGHHGSFCRGFLGSLSTAMLITNSPISLPLSFSHTFTCSLLGLCRREYIIRVCLVGQGEAFRTCRRRCVGECCIGEAKVASFWCP